MTVESAQGTSDTPNAKVLFPLETEDGWPPYPAESVWAVHLGEDRYRIDNVPWFVRDLAVGDIVRATPPGEGELPAFVEMLERSDHVTIRLICLRDGPLSSDLGLALEPFTKLGVYGEGFGQYRMLALDVEPDAPLPAVRAILDRGTLDGAWEYEEGRITDRWRETAG